MTNSGTRYGCLVLGILLVGCAPSVKSGRGFTLPDGNIEQGKLVYEEMRCNTCHVIDGTPQLESGSENQISITLGGKVNRVTTYGEMVTSIINPSHRLAQGHPRELVSLEGESKMQNYNDVLTVTQLIDLVAFLQSKYELEAYTPTNYPVFEYGP